MDDRDLPPIVREYWYSIDWDVEAIWALDLPTVRFAVNKLTWHLDVPIWPFGGRTYAITPRQVMSDPQTYAEEALRLEAADLAFPIDVVRHRDRWMILDGVHRLAKVVRSGAAEIDARIVPISAVREL